jgi:formiminotetrahydrofolate cyclodeaminase
MSEHNINFMECSCKEFADILASKEPVPGGGGASAYVGALGTALGAMVGNLTAGKAKYAEVQDQIEDLLDKSEALRVRLQKLVDEDARIFLPLSKAYGLPSETEAEKMAKDEALELALKAACDVPLSIMKASCEAIELNREYAEIGNRLALSDAGAGAVFCKAALIGASLNVFINIKLMKDRGYAKMTGEVAEAMIDEYCKKADAVLALVMESM